MATKTYSYGDIERALIAAFDIPETGALALRARLQHLRRQGVPADLPASGKGKRVEFTAQHVHQLVLALQLEAAGLDPKDIPAVVCGVFALPQGQIGIAASMASGGQEWWLLLGMNFLLGNANLVGVVADSVLANHVAKNRSTFDRLLLVNLSRRGRATFAALP